MLSDNRVAHVWLLLCTVAWVSAFGSLVYASKSGAHWPLAFAEVSLLIAGACHLVSTRSRL